MAGMPNKPPIPTSRPTRNKSRWYPDPFFRFLSDLLIILLQTNGDLYLYIFLISVDISDKVEYGVHDTSHIYPLCAIFKFSLHGHQIEGDQRPQWHFFQKTLAKWGKGNCQSFLAAPVGFVPAISRSSVARSNN